MKTGYLQQTTAPSADDRLLVKKTLRQIKLEFGAAVEPFTLHLPLPELQAGAWMACRESLLAGTVRRDVKEAVASTVSLINRCPYCVDAHNIMMLASSGKDYSSQILEGRYDDIDDPEIGTAARWAAATLSPGSSPLHSPPFSAREAPEYIGTAVLFHYINRMVTILLGTSPLPFQKGILKRMAQRMAAFFFSKAVRLNKEPCASLALLPASDLPFDLGWSRSSPCIAGAYAAFSRAVDHAAETVLSKPVRASVSGALDAWDGSVFGPGNPLPIECISEYGGAERTAAAMALFAALAPYRVTDDMMADFVNRYPAEEERLAVLAWGSFSAARRIGRWIGGFSV